MKYFNCTKFFFLNFKRDQIKQFFYLVAAEYFYRVSLGGARLPVSSSGSAFGMGAQSLTVWWDNIHKWGSSCYSWRKHQKARLRLDNRLKHPHPECNTDNSCLLFVQSCHKLPKRLILNFLSYHFHRIEPGSAGESFVHSVRSREF